MYLRHTTRTKDGKTHVYWRLVRSVRRGRKVVQETVAQLGELDAEGRARAAVLARKISGRANSQGNLFEANAPIEAAAVRLDAVRLERSRSFGAVWLSWIVWQALKFDELLSGLLPRGREAEGFSPDASRREQIFQRGRLILHAVGVAEIQHVRAVFLAQFGDGCPAPTDLPPLRPRESAGVNGEAHAAEQASVAANAFELASKKRAVVIGEQRWICVETGSECATCRCRCQSSATRSTSHRVEAVRSGLRPALISLRFRQ